MPPPYRVVAFAGSLREASYNRALLRAALEVAPPSLAIEIHDLLEIPVFNQDVEAAGDPPPVARLKAAIGAADGLLIATPEYNHGPSGVTKNAVDWLSRPPRGSVLRGRPAAILGASMGATGTARAQSALRQSFVFTDTPAMLQPEFLLARAQEKFDAEGRLVDETSRRYLGRFLESFAAWIARFPLAS
jgi:chromate reductase